MNSKQINKTAKSLKELIKYYLCEISNISIGDEKMVGQNILHIEYYWENEIGLIVDDDVKEYHNDFFEFYDDKVISEIVKSLIGTNHFDDYSFEEVLTEFNNICDVDIDIIDEDFPNILKIMCNFK